MCNDVAEMKKFYTGLLGMQEVAFMDEEEFGWLCYQCEGFQFMFFKTHGKVPVLSDFTWQPGWGGGRPAAAGAPAALPVWLVDSGGL